MTKGQYEAEISKKISKFESDYMGRGPIKICTKIIEDVVLVRLWGFLTPAEKLVAKTSEGTDLIKKVRVRLFEGADHQFRQVINNILEEEIISIHSDVSTVTGEKIIVITFEKNINFDNN
jgi:uncharacterized protein YbcI